MFTEWAKKWDLVLNLQKTKSMLFGSKGTDNIQLCIEGIQIEQVCEFKYLGITLDEQLKFDAQAEYSVTKARKALAKVNRLFDGRNGISVRLGIE